MTTQPLQPLAPAVIPPAVIEVEDKAIKDAGPPVRVQFNPAEYTLTKGAQIAEIAINGLDSPVLQFVRGNNEKLTVDLFFDTASLGKNDQGKYQDVTKMTKPVYQMVKINPESHAPPRIRFRWGDGISFRAVVESVQQKFSLFSPEGVPLRATLSLTLREYKNLREQLSEIGFESADHTKVYVVQERDTLVQIAAREYGTPVPWRMIAEENDIQDPLNLRPGTELRIPPVDLTKTSESRRGAA